MRRLIGLVVLLAVSIAVSGCGPSTTTTTGPSGDNRSKEQRESDDMMQKALQEYRSKQKRR
jgi:hypothetical protein